MRRPWWQRMAGVFARARSRRRRRTSTLRGRAATTAVVLIAGYLIGVSAVESAGSDLRPSRNTDLVDYVQAQARRNSDLAAQVSELRGEVDRLSRAVDAGSVDAAAQVEAADRAALTPVHGPAVTVTLRDAPLEVEPEGVDADLLVVHQQDIQAVVNALWQGGAEAMTVQGQRVTSRTGIKCVGNTVVLHGIPYGPPYVISAIGDQGALEASLESNGYLMIYRQYVKAYALGYSQSRQADVAFPAYEGSIDLRYARAKR